MCPVRFSEEDAQVLAEKGGGEARRRARSILSDAKREQVEDCAAKALAAIVGYPLGVRRRGLERALKMMRVR